MSETPMIPTGTGPTRVRLILARNGQIVVLKSETTSGQEGSDPLNNELSSAEAYGPKSGTLEGSEILCAVYHPQGNEQEDMPSGSSNLRRPVAAFPRRGIAVTPEEGDRFEYEGVEYELRVQTKYPEYTAWEVRNTDG